MNSRWQRRSAEWLRSTGQALIAAGLLVLLFAGYQPWADKTTILTEQEHYPMWPTYVFGGLLALLLVLAERWRRISARPWLVVLGALVVVTPVVLVWFNAISHVLPAGI